MQKETKKNLFKEKENRIELSSVSCPSSGRNQDCGILVLVTIIASLNYKDDNFVYYDDVLKYVSKTHEEFTGNKFGDEQIGVDMIENVLRHFLPDYEIEFYNIVTKSFGETEVNVRILNEKAQKKAPYRLALLSSWDHNNNTVGAGHYVMLNTTIGTQEEILQELKAGHFDRGKTTIQSCVQCMRYPVFLREYNSYKTFCNKKCQAKFY